MEKLEEEAHVLCCIVITAPACTRCTRRDKDFRFDALFCRQEKGKAVAVIVIRGKMETNKGSADLLKTSAN